MLVINVNIPKKFFLLILAQMFSAEFLLSNEQNKEKTMSRRHFGAKRGYGNMNRKTLIN